jgi:hypothetical protein
MKVWSSPNVDVKLHCFSGINDDVNEDLYVDFLDKGNRVGEYHVVKSGHPGMERFTHIILSSDRANFEVIPNGDHDIVTYHGRTYYEWLDEAKNKLFKNGV